MKPRRPSCDLCYFKQRGRLREQGEQEASLWSSDCVREEQQKRVRI